MFKMTTKDSRNEAVREKIRHRIETLCQRQNVSQSALARELGLQRQAVSKWLTIRDQVPNEINMLEVARILGTSVSYLYGETDDPGPARNWLTGEGPGSEWDYRLEQARIKLDEIQALLTGQTGISSERAELERIASTSARGSTLYPTEAERKPKRAQGQGS